MLRAPGSTPPPLRYLIPPSSAVEYRSCGRAAAAIVQPRVHPQTDLIGPADSRTFLPADSRSHAHVPIRAACSSCQTFRKARCTFADRLALSQSSPRQFFESFGQAHEYAHPSRSACCPARLHREVCAQFHDRRRRQKLRAVQKNHLCRFHPHRSAVRTSPANALLRNRASPRREFLARVQIARIPPRPCLERAPLVLSRTPPR